MSQNFEFLTSVPDKGTRSEESRHWMEEKIRTQKPAAPGVPEADSGAAVVGV